ncbi:MAG: YbjQ family protein [Myxococcales bacterium FL481]|nr:MAG: YbjQ family protein [Myxococcales bacterium FL481]
MTALARPSDSSLAPAAGELLLATTDVVPGYRVTKVLGLVRGNTVRVRHVGADILAGLRGLIGGEVNEYTAMLAQSREQALDRLRSEALARGANAVVGMRITTSTVMQAAAEILAYGTAVVLTADPPPAG